MQTNTFNSLFNSFLGSDLETFVYKMYDTINEIDEQTIEAKKRLDDEYKASMNLPRKQKKAKRKLIALDRVYYDYISKPF